MVSDFSLIDAIESRHRESAARARRRRRHDRRAAHLPRPWLHIRDDLPKKGRRTEDVTGEPPSCPPSWKAPCTACTATTRSHYRKWQAHAADGAEPQPTPPVFIVVCNNTNVSKLVFDYIAGWEKPLPDGHDGRSCRATCRCSATSSDGRWLARPNTILIDSEQLESGEAMSAEFKKIAAREIEEFKAEYRAALPGRDAEDLTDEDLLREVMNTVGKPGKLGEQVKCVVSVSMLTEGWDANTVTHILGVRAFGTQLLCEQVVGRGLRRMSYVANADGMFEPEYAEVYGVPFSFIPCAGSAAEPKKTRRTRVRPWRSASPARSPSRVCRLPLRDAQPSG